MPRFFRSAAEFRAWLEKHHGRSQELVLGFHKKSSAKKGITYLEAVNEALCFGWIDGLGRSLDEERYSVRFTPRKPRSNWSAINIKRVRQLKKAGRMTAAGLEAFARRDQKK
jgi:uncharacterized protein YdeI (YjbR/CyaY-like superfamily)